MRTSYKNFCLRISWIIVVVAFFASVSAQQKDLIAPAISIDQRTAKDTGRPIGSACSTQTDCIEGASCSYNRCECSPGSVPQFGGQECRRAVLQSCTRDEECVIAAKCTGVADSRTCRCDFNQGLQSTANKTRCGVQADTECDPNGVQCVDFAQCIKDISSPKHFCKCIEDYSWTPTGTCSGSGMLSPKSILISGFVGLLAYVRFSK